MNEFWGKEYNEEMAKMEKGIKFLQDNKDFIDHLRKFQQEVRGWISAEYGTIRVFEANPEVMAHVMQCPLVLGVEQKIFDKSEGKMVYHLKLTTEALVTVGALKSLCKSRRIDEETKREDVFTHYEPIGECDPLFADPGKEDQEEEKK